MQPQQTGTALLQKQLDVWEAGWALTCPSQGLMLLPARCCLEHSPGQGLCVVLGMAAGAGDVGAGEVKQKARLGSS